MKWLRAFLRRFRKSCKVEPLRAYDPDTQRCEHRPYGYDCDAFPCYFMDGAWICQDCAELAYG